MTMKDGLVSLQFRVHPTNVERIKKFVETVEPVDEEGSISLEEFFVNTSPVKQKQPSV